MTLKTKTKSITVDAPTRSLKHLLIESADVNAVLSDIRVFTDDELSVVSLEDDSGTDTIVVDSDVDMTINQIDFRQDQFEGKTTARVFLVKKLQVSPEIMDKARAYDILMGGA